MTTTTTKNANGCLKPATVDEAYSIFSASRTHPQLAGLAAKAFAARLRAKGATIPEGIIYRHPEGGTWSIIGAYEGSEHGTMVACGQSLRAPEDPPEDDDELIEGDDALLLWVTIDHDRDPFCVAYSHPHGDDDQKRCE